MFQTKSGSRFIATIVATAVAATFSLPTSANAAVPAKYTTTDTFLRNAFVANKYVEGFTPGKPDFGFSLEALLQRYALGEPAGQLTPSVKFLLESKSTTGTPANYTGYLFTDGKLNIGQVGKWSFVSRVLKANNLSTRKSVLHSAMDLQLRSGDLSQEVTATTFDRAWLVLGLAANGYAKQAVSLGTAIIAHQQSDGGWDDGYTMDASSPDGTGITLQALAVARSHAGGSTKTRINAAIGSACKYLNKTLVGGDHYESWGDYNTNGTLYAQMGLTAVGRSNAAVAAWIRGHVATDGGIQTPWSASAGDVFATAQGAVALMGSSYAGLLR
jgi:hypothetical protein